MCDPNHNDASQVPVIDLAKAPGERTSWGKPAWIVFVWSLVEILLVTNPFQISSRLRIAVLRLFGAEIGKHVIFRPRTRIKYPWNLVVGDRCWIGEGVWIHNQASVKIGSDVVISQEAFITSGSHAHRRDMGLITSPVAIASGVWVSSRAIVLGGTSIGKSCLITPASVVGPMQTYEDAVILRGNPATTVGLRFQGKNP